MTQPIFYAIFYDVAFPKTYHHSMFKVVTKAVFENLSEELKDKYPIFTKEVELKFNDDSPFVKYLVEHVTTFQIYNSVENHVYVVCDIKKI